MRHGINKLQCNDDDDDDEEEEEEEEESSKIFFTHPPKLGRHKQIPKSAKKSISTWFDENMQCYKNL